MDWFYVVDEEKQGPVTLADLKSLTQAGKINGDTLVWNKTIPDWMPLKEAAKKPKSPEMASDAPSDVESVSKASCSECGALFSEEELVEYSGSRICASCKPLFIQKLKEGVSVGHMVYAGFWIRAGAKIIDWIILGIVNMAIGMLLGAFTSNMSDPDSINSASLVGIQALGMLIQIAINAAYVTWFLGKFKATPGKMACGLIVVTGENENVSYMRAFGRYFAEMLSGIILCIGYLMVAFDSEKKSFHDRLCNTRVIKK